MRVNKSVGRGARLRASEALPAGVTDLDREVLMLHLRQAFGGTPGERRAVARAATDLADSGQLAADRGEPLTPELVVSELAAAPDDGVADRWNWWIGSLEVAYGGYAAFDVRRWEEEP